MFSLAHGVVRTGRRKRMYTCKDRQTKAPGDVVGREPGRKTVGGTEANARQPDVEADSQTTADARENVRSADIGE